MKDKQYFSGQSHDSNLRTTFLLLFWGRISWVSSQSKISSIAEIDPIPDMDNAILKSSSRFFDFLQVSRSTSSISFETPSINFNRDWIWNAWVGSRLAFTASINCSFLFIILFGGIPDTISSMIFPLSNPSTLSRPDFPKPSETTWRQPDAAWIQDLMDSVL